MTVYEVLSYLASVIMLMFSVYMFEVMQNSR